LKCGFENKFYDIFRLNRQLHHSFIKNRFIV